MTKKFGDHKYDQFVAVNPAGSNKKYGIQHKDAPYNKFFFDSIKDVRYLISFNETGYRLACDFGREAKSIVHPSQPRPAAKPAPKLHVPKALKAIKASTWPFPIVKAPSPPPPQTVTVNGITIEFEPGVQIEIVSKKLIKITKV